mmetsp:Transcript_36703/g.41993  ORF Transcript_36703/g.41993 Transcript_36703/m.41993 type:complete len:1016 (-) Transcript_36703:611-3658(-)
MMSDFDNEVYDDDDDVDDDDMLDLFSFGAETSTTAAAAAAATQLVPTDPSSSNKTTITSASDINKLHMYLSVEDDDDEESFGSNDSFLELLENAQQTDVSIIEDITASISIRGNNKDEYNKQKEGKNNLKHQSDDSDMQEILDWLDDDDDIGKGILQRQEEEFIFEMKPSSRPPTTSKLEELIDDQKPKCVSSSPQPQEYNSLEEAVKSRESSKDEIKRLLEKEKFVVSTHIRPHLWCKVICEKTIEEMLQSSLVDSFQQWERKYSKNCVARASSSINKTNPQEKEENRQTVQYTKQHDDPDLQQQTSQEGNLHSQKSSMCRQEQQREWLEEQSNILANRIVATVKKGGDFQFYRKALTTIMIYHYDTGNKAIEDGDFWKDPLLPPIVCCILCAGVPIPVACVMLSQIIPSFMPILALTIKERKRVATILHLQFYLLASYHLPLLVLHLDKYVTNWYKWPPHGHLPQSWLISHLAGETDGNYMNQRWLLRLWDLVLTSSNTSLRLFLIIAILDMHAETLLLLTGDNLKEELQRVVSFSLNSNTKAVTNVGIAAQTEEEMCDQQANQWVKEWSDKAVLLWEETPVSITRRLKVLEDETVSETLLARQKAKEEQLRLQQEVNMKALQVAREVEQERKADEARLRLTRARLVSFYRQYNPGKENNIDKIMKTYDGRYDILDAKLKLKYGVGFNPSLKPNPIVINRNNNKIFAAMNSGFGGRRSSKIKMDRDISFRLEERKCPVTQVSPREVLPVICWSKHATRGKISKLKNISKLENDGSERTPLKFYLVDSRPVDAAQDQGRLPTSLSLSPETLNDVFNMNEEEMMFESLRGSVHICIMGEGYASLPNLYGHKMTNGLAEFIREDDLRNNKCALFFLSRGFPFVSIMEGGFAAAHACLCREGSKMGLNVNDVLTDYNAEISLFGQFEKLHSLSGRDKAQRSLQNIFDSSMTALTKKSMRFETDSIGVNIDEQTQQKGGQKNVVQRFFGGKNERIVDDKQPSGRNPFARKFFTNNSKR